MTAQRPILLIKPPLIGAGFGACLLTALNYVRYCEREDLTPVIHIDASCNTRFLDPDYGDNVWEQYFEPVGPYTSAELQRMLVDPACSQLASQLRTVDDSLPERIKANSDSIFTWTFGHWRKETPGDIEAWFAEQRRKGRETVSERVRVRPRVLEKVERFFEREMKGRQVLGVHIRGTDLHYAPPVSPAEYFVSIDRYLEGHPDAAIFLATDQVQYLEVMKKRYGRILLHHECLRSATSTAPFEMATGSPYQKGEDVLIDILLLARCAFMIRGASNVPEMAIYFGQALGSKDLSLEKRFAFGQDYGERWFSLATRPAWEMIQKTDLEEIPEDAASQTALQRAHYEWRRVRGKVVRTRRKVKRRLRRLLRGQKS
jgi:hypothetical protein